jgi:hypothetical protein
VGGGAAGQPPSRTLSLLAGGLGGPGNVDGTGAAARFTRPYGLVTDGAGNLFVADTDNHTIRKIVIATGAVTTFVGAAGEAGATDGTGAAARFDSPVGVASDGAGNLFVADASNNAIRKVVIATGAVTTLVAAGAHLSSPFGVVSDGTGNLFVTDTYNHTIRKVVIASGAITTLAGSAGQFGGTDGKGSAARFYYPSSITTDGAGNLFVADTDNHAVRKIVIATGAVTTFAGTLGQNGSVDGAAAESRFNYPSGVALDGAGSLFVTDANNQSIRKVIIATGAVTTLVGSTEGYADGTGGYARFRYPFGIASDGAGDLFVGDTNNDCIRKIVVATGTVTTFAGAASHAGNADGTGTAASLSRSNGVATDGSGNLYVVDSDNQTIRKVVIATGVVTTLAGSVGQTGSTDGTGTAARFYRPSGIASDGAGNLFVTDTWNSTVRKIVVATGAVTTFAGAAGQWNNTDGPGTTARFFVPVGITSDGAGNLYVADSTATRKIVIATTVVSTVANVPARSPEDGGPPGIASDGAGNLYFADYATIRKVVIATGAVTTLAGSGDVGAADGTGTAASFSSPRGLASDGAGNLYLADGNTIRKIAVATGAVSTVIGSAGRVGVSPGPLPASLNAPYGVTVLPTGDLAITDTGENAVLLGRF